MTLKNVIITGQFDQMDFTQLRFIHEASRLGNVNAILFDDRMIENLTDTSPKFPLAERIYFVENIRYVQKVHTISSFEQLEDLKKLTDLVIDQWVTLEQDEKLAKQFAEKQNIKHHIIHQAKLDGYPEHDYDKSQSLAKKVIVTGCFDWLHTGHVRFFEEASQYGDLYVALGNDKNLQQLKGPGHPMFSQDIRKYLVGSIKFVKKALVSRGMGWLDAQQEIEELKPDLYITNEDGDKQIKRDYCQTKGIEYKVLKREPKSGLTRRTSTCLRGF